MPNIKSLLGGRPMLFCLTIFEDPDEDLDGTYVATGGSDGTHRHRLAGHMEAVSIGLTELKLATLT